MPWLCCVGLSLLLVTTLVDAQSPLLDAIRQDDVGTVKQLLESGADPNERNDAGATALADEESRFVSTTFTTLGLAAFVGAVDTVRVLVEGGADVDATDSRGHTPLMMAAAGATDECRNRELSA